MALIARPPLDSVGLRPTGAPLYPLQHRLQPLGQFCPVARQFVPHPNAVVSLGVADEVDCQSCAELEPTYEQVCPYIHVFEDEAWADTTAAATTHVPVETGVALAGALARNLFGPAS